MARPQTGDDVDEARQHQGPCRLKVEIPAPAILVGQHVSVASRDCRSRRRDRNLEQRRSPRIAHFAPIEARVRDQDLNAGDQQSNERNYCDPVRHPDEQSMPGRSLISERGSARHAGSIARSGAASPVLSPLAFPWKGPSSSPTGLDRRYIASLTMSALSISIGAHFSMHSMRSAISL